jgi:hypothetical protein
MFIRMKMTEVEWRLSGPQNSSGHCGVGTPAVQPRAHHYTN